MNQDAGRVDSIHIAARAGEALVALQEAVVVPERGLEGDRYYLKAGTFDAKPGPGRHVTLIEAESLAGLATEQGIKLGPGESRRNIVTAGIRLNPLVGHSFRIGEAVLRGVRLCHPCQHLEGLTRPGVLAGLKERGGLRADIVTGGRIRVGDAIQVLPGGPAADAPSAAGATAAPKK
ncbi:MAG: MOSC domain-containing protein [Planctomycetes bacterium]|nr:MOSC domain-containing protein [Planctomycetota bacterium]